MFEAAGCTNVVTYINSGNVVFSAPSAVLKKLTVTIPNLIEAQFGFRVPLVLRSGSDLTRIIAANPYPEAVVEPQKLAVMFLANEPSADAVAALDPSRSPGDRFHVIGSDIYLHLPKGFADTKLNNAYFDSKLKTISTGRNWNTVLKLYTMTGEVSR